MPGRVQHSRHSHCLAGFIDFLDDAVGKPFRITPSEVLDGMSAAVEQRVFCQGIPHADDVLDELRSESRLPGFLPIGRFGNVQLDLRCELDAPVHWRWRERSRAFISSSAMAEAAVSFRAASRDSTKD